MGDQIKEILRNEQRKPNKRIFVGNLNPETPDDEVRENFQRFGDITYFERKKLEYAILEF